LGFPNLTFPSSFAFLPENTSENPTILFIRLPFCGYSICRIVCSDFYQSVICCVSPFFFSANAASSASSRGDAGGDQEVLPQRRQRTVRLVRRRLLLLARRPVRQRHIRRRCPVRRASINLLLSQLLRCVATDAAWRQFNAATSLASTLRARSLQPSAASRASFPCTDDFLFVQTTAVD